MSTINMGPDTHSIAVSMFKENRDRVVAALRTHKGVPDHSIVLLEGGNTINLYNTDVQYVFRQVSTVIYK